MTDEREIARITFWLGHDADRVFAAYKTKEQLEREAGVLLTLDETEE